MHHKESPQERAISGMCGIYHIIKLTRRLQQEYHTKYLDVF